ncbi:MAG: hypothetical protein M3019_01755 [Candidatus Dormibacteraeota bacterium]|nr:hypothetical protein [Candidatus Dormibacteraeota bacterium]
MSRVIQVRVRGVPLEARELLHQRFSGLVGGREWRDGTPWLADPFSRDLLSQLFFDKAQEEARVAGDERPLSAAGFVRIAGDEADALALAFIVRDVSERLAADVELRDPDNPIAKLRHVVLGNGRLRNGRPLESILVRRVIYRRMPDGSRMEMIPPHGRGSAFGQRIGDHGDNSWSFIVHDIRVVDESFLDAEAEAMRIFRGFRALPSDDRA